MSDTYEAGRPIMGRDELASHKVTSHGRDFSKSDDGYDDMEIAERAKWRAVSGWGRDGWDLGDWPYVVIYTRTVDGKFQVQQVVEGDHDVYSFDTEQDRNAAIDYLFLWCSAGKDHGWEPFNWQQRDLIDAGAVEVDPKFRGPFAWSRCEPLNA